MDLALVIPFHNEERCLPLLIGSLRKQTEQDVPVVFVDNASTDTSPAIVKACEEIRSGRWTYLEEPKVGKIHAVRMATAFCRERLDATYVAFIDSDSYFDDAKWVGNSLDIIDVAGGRCGYSYSPFVYFGFEAFPIFLSAYLAYENVQQQTLKQVGWLANGQAWICPTATLTRYFAQADITTEFDLRCSLLTLSEGQRAYLNPTLLATSGRRITVNARNFAGWCFYDRSFYSAKDVNASAKLNLARQDGIDDLDPSMIGRLFKCRALKLAGRHLMPLAIFDEQGEFFEKIRSALGIDLPDDLHDMGEQFRENVDWLFTDRFQEMIHRIESHRGTIAVASRLETLMCERYEEMVAAAGVDVFDRSRECGELQGWR